MTESGADYAEAQAKIAQSIAEDRRARPLFEASTILERVEVQLRKSVRRHRTLDLAQLDWLAGQVGEAAALVKAAWEHEA